jgi:hypothetical protein
MRRGLLLVLLISSRLAAADPAVTEGMSNGRAWTGLGGGDPKTAVMLKFIYLVGLWDGLRQEQGELIPAMCPKPTPGQDEKAAAITPTLLPAGKDLVTMIPALDT